VECRGGLVEVPARWLAEWRLEWATGNQCKGWARPFLAPAAPMRPANLAPRALKSRPQLTAQSDFVPTEPTC